MRSLWRDVPRRYPRQAGRHVQPDQQWIICSRTSAFAGFGHSALGSECPQLVKTIWPSPVGGADPAAPDAGGYGLATELPREWPTDERLRRHQASPAWQATHASPRDKPGVAFQGIQRLLATKFKPVEVPVPAASPEEARYHPLPPDGRRRRRGSCAGQRVARHVVRGEAADEQQKR